MIVWIVVVSVCVPFGIGILKYCLSRLADS